MFASSGKVDRKSMIPAVEVTRPIKAGEQLYVCYYGERDQDFKDYVRSLPSGPVACTWVSGLDPCKAGAPIAACRLRLPCELLPGQSCRRP